MSDLLASLLTNTLVLTALSFIGRGVVDRIFARDLEAFKARLTAEAGTQAAIAQRAAWEHQVTFSKLHEKRVDVLEELADHLARVFSAAWQYLHPIQYSGGPSKDVLYGKWLEAAIAFGERFERSRIYLDEKLCDEIVAFVDEMRQRVSTFEIVRTETSSSRETTEAKLKTWMEGYDAFGKEGRVRALREKIEAEFRKLLTDGRSSTELR